MEPKILAVLLGGIVPQTTESSSLTERAMASKMVELQGECMAKGGGDTYCAVELNRWTKQYFQKSNDVRRALHQFLGFHVLSVKK